MDGLAAESRQPWLDIRAEVDRTLAAIDPDQFGDVVRALDDPARRWFFTGQGRSGYSARMAAMRVMHLDREAHVLGETTCPSVRAGDGLIVVSGSGATPVSLRFAGIARDENAHVVAVTAHRDSPLGQIADVTLVVPATDSRQLGGSLFEQCALLTLDAVIMAIAARLPDAPRVLAQRHTNMQ